MKNSAQAVRQRIVVMSLLPGLLISILVSSLYLWARFSELDQGLLNKAQNKTGRIATFIASTDLRKHPHDIQTLASLALEDMDVRAVCILNAEGEETIHAGPKLAPLATDKPLPSSLRISTGEYSLRVTTPLITGDAVKGHQITGWLQMEYTYAEVRLAKYRALLLSGLLVVMCLGIGLTLSLRLGRAITSPLSEITETASKIHSGQLNIRLKAQPYSLLHEFEQTINEMLDSLEQAQVEMQKNVDLTTDELRETLETIEIQNVELDLARKEALQASKSKSEFLANMSHEIRTPLNGITGYTNLMLETELKPQQYQYLSTIEKSAQGLMSMLNDILDFSRIEAGKLELENQPFNIREVIEDTLAIMAPDAHRKSLELVSFIYQDTPVEIMGDRQRLTQILTNLVNNAVKFTHFGSVSVRAMLEYEDNDGCLTLKCSVTDTGSGLTTEQHSLLFKAFSQADSSRTRQSGGTGLGLVISKSLVEQMQGEIGLESDLGQGSTFWFTFRTRRVDAKQNVQNRKILPNCENVLLCEAQELTRLSISHQLQSLGCKVQSFSNRGDLQSHLTKQNTNVQDLILLSQEDQPLPQVLDVAETLTSYAPVIILTLAGTPEEYPQSMPEAINTLMKPISRNRLEEMLQIMTSGNERHGAIARSQQTFYKSLNILIVDDNPVNLKLLETILSNMGQQVITATSGYEAVDYCMKQTPDMIFMDVQMPGIDGMETTRQIRALKPQDHRLPIIAVTAHALPEERKQILESGMDDHMTKPVNPRQLVYFITHWTGNKLKLPVKKDTPAENIKQPMAIDSPVDSARSIQLAAGNKELAWEMLEMLLTGLDSDLHTIRESLEQNDQDALLERVHRLHGACRYCGVPQLEEACYRLETRLKQAPDLSGDSILNGIDRLVKAIEQLQFWREQNPGIAVLA